MRRVSEGGELTDVALDLGFSAPGNFSRFFKEHTGISPSIFKRATRAPSPVTVTGIPREGQSPSPSADVPEDEGERGHIRSL